MEIPVSLMTALHKTMIRIRLVEERIAELVESNEVKCPCHLYIGQEAVAAGVCAVLTKEDFVWGGHRSHGHYLAKGGDLRSMMAEIFGKATGCSHGRGGSMHLVAPEIGILGTVPIVAATIPLAVGAGLSAKLSGNGRVSVSFFGDGAMEEGHFHEAVNMAALYRLPVIFACENNFYSSHLQLFQRRVEDNLYKAGEFHGIPGVRLDGNDVAAVYRATAEAVERARAGQGPTFLEFRTYRWRGHVGASWDMDVGVKRKNELDEWLPKDPIRKVREELIRKGIPGVDLEQTEAEIRGEIEDAVAYARNSPDPEPRELLKQVYSQRNGPE